MEVDRGVARSAIDCSGVEGFNGPACCEVEHVLTSELRDLGHLSTKDG